MGSSLNLTTTSLNLSFSHSHPSSTTPLFRGSVKLLQFNKFGKALKLSSTQSISGFPSFASYKLCTSTTAPQRLQSLNVFAAKGYKMKTHKVLLLSLLWFLTERRKYSNFEGKFGNCAFLMDLVFSYGVLGFCKAVQGDRRGKIVRRRAGKQHLLAKKNTKRKLRLSKMVVDPFSLLANVVSLVELGLISELCLGMSIISITRSRSPSSSKEKRILKEQLSIAAFLSLHAVSRSDYDNVIGALPYGKVNRNAK
ncbi:hypothetical protein CXB51_003338 [Gossypium anomalum]|uniref:Uncharacterized protein n=1 Tax=Gossypium anomalum TaxID=47600 RepID=A0A8J6DBJ5_9ROSI|nr:hypothetical protein CXB51_003338 [Gossypium anomalum]